MLKPKDQGSTKTRRKVETISQTSLKQPLNKINFKKAQKKKQKIYKNNKYQLNILKMLENSFVNFYDK